MSWIQTFSGRAFHPLAVEPGVVDIGDIAHALSLQCRFNGHCRTFYSVADHSVRVSRVVPAADALWGLLHDAAEAYLSDLPRPLKRQMPAFEEMEDRLLQRIMARYGLGWPMPESVREADEILLATEKRDLMAPEPASWHLRGTPLPESVVPLSPEAAESAFLARFHDLYRE